MRQPEFTDEAAKDLNHIHDYIGRDSPAAAGHFIQMIEERCDTLAENPSLGRSRPELGRNIRSFPAGNYVVFYRPTEEGVDVVRVIHGARDITTMF